MKKILINDKKGNSICDILFYDYKVEKKVLRLLSKNKNLIVKEEK